MGVWRAATVCLLSGSVLSGCALWRDAREPDERIDAEPKLAATDLRYQTVDEAFVTPANPPDEVDSVATWMAPDGVRWLIASGKDSHQLLAFNGDTGALLKRIGGKGSAPGQFDRPNGVMTWGDLLFVVERDNRRVQVLSLPELQPLATFGEDVLRSPYGLSISEPEAGRLDLLVTDSFMDGKDFDVIPPLAQLVQRIKRFSVLVDGDAVSARLEGNFGDTTEAGALRVVESIATDPANERLLIAEEDVPTGTGYRIYSPAGEFTGKNLGVGEFKAQAEGLALWACGDGSGYWVGTDQFTDRSLFRVYDRRTLEFLGAFAGKTTAATDGIGLSQAPTTRFPAGVLYAAHDDQAVSAFDWRSIASALALRTECP